MWHDISLCMHLCEYTAVPVVSLCGPNKSLLLALGEDAGACSEFSMDWSGIAVSPGSAQSQPGEINYKHLIVSVTLRRPTPVASN